MEFSQMRDGRFVVYMEDNWIGTVGQLPTGMWCFIGRLSMGAYGIGMTIEGAVYNALKEGNGEAIKVLEQVQMH